MQTRHETDEGDKAIADTAIALGIVIIRTLFHLFSPHPLVRELP